MQKQVGLGAHVRPRAAATRPSLVGSPGHAPQWLADGSACAVGLSASITMRRLWWVAALIICASRGALALFPAVSAYHLGCFFPSPPSPQPPPATPHDCRQFAYDGWRAIHNICMHLHCVDCAQPWVIMTSPFMHAHTPYKSRRDKTRVRVTLHDASLCLSSPHRCR
jgi:hypothetical protein